MPILHKYVERENSMPDSMGQQQCHAIICFNPVSQLQNKNFRMR